MGTKFDGFTAETGREDSESVPGGEGQEIVPNRIGNRRFALVKVRGVLWSMQRGKRMAASTRTKVALGERDGDRNGVCKRLKMTTRAIRIR
jgi:hypothetical protein